MAYVDMYKGKSHSEAKKDSDTVEMSGLKKDLKTETVNQDYVKMAKSHSEAKQDSTWTCLASKKMSERLKQELKEVEEVE